MRKRIVSWLAFLVVILVPTFFTWGYARDSRRRELESASTEIERSRVGSAAAYSRDIQDSIAKAKAVVQSIPASNTSVEDAMRILRASIPAYAEIVSLGPGEEPGPASSDRRGVRPGWYHITYTSDGAHDFWIGNGDDIVVLRALGGGRRVGFAFTAAKVESDVALAIASRGLALERFTRADTEKGPEPDELGARMSDMAPKMARIVGIGQVVLNPRATWNVVVRDPGQAYQRQESVSRTRYLTRLAFAGLFDLIALVLFVRGQRQKHLADLRTDFVASVSHELRTPLASVRMFAELLEANAVPAEERPEVERSLATESRRLHGTLERMMRFGALSRGKLAVERKLVPLRPLLLAAAARAGERVIVTADSALEASVDEGLLGHALDNLLGNANKYAPHGPIELRAAREGKRIAIHVTDHGPGLSWRARRTIFQPFERADARLSKATEGTGVGLALVRGIAEAHGGTATVTSTPGQGATFTIRIPQQS